jgi:diguanylate cyclase (GGDEF)-like protein
MQPVHHLNLDELPESPYAAALQESAERALRFPPDLEAGYRAFQLDNARGVVRTWIGLVLLVMFLAGTRRLLGEGAPEGAPSGGVYWFLLLPSWTILTAVTWSRRYAAWYRPVARVAIPLVTLLLAAPAARMLAHGHVEGAAGVAISVLASYLLIGALFVEALAVSGFALVGFLSGALGAVGPIPGFWPWAGLITVLAAVGALASYGFEKTGRKLFLESGLLREMVWRDGLTGLRNRRAFDDHLSAVWAQATRDKHTVGLLLVDIDHFKAYNDARGHQRGDQCLQQVAAVIKSFARRPLDMAARYGGEELVVVLYHPGSERTLEIAEDLRRAVERVRIEHPQSPTSQFVTVSVGAACVRPRPDRSAGGLVQLADEALYVAKHQARNCVHFQQSEYMTLDTGTFRGPAVRPPGPAERATVRPPDARDPGRAAGNRAASR